MGTFSRPGRNVTVHLSFFGLPCLYNFPNLKQKNHVWKPLPRISYIPRDQQKLESLSVLWCWNTYLLFSSSPLTSVKMILKIATAPSIYPKPINKVMITVKIPIKTIFDISITSYCYHFKFRRTIQKRHKWLLVRTVDRSNSIIRNAMIFKNF